MGFFKPEPQSIYGAVDVGSDSIKAVIFERPAGAGLPRIVEKFVWGLPAAYTGLRLVQKIREGVFAMVRKMERVPERIVIAIGPTAAECASNTWRATLSNGGKMLTRRDIQTHYQRLFEENSDLRRAVITAPVEILINGYPFTWQENRPSEEVLPRAQVKDIAFRTLSLYMPVESGAMFAEIKNTLGGMPIEFIPLALAEKEAVVSALGSGDALIVDVGGAESSLISVKKGQFSHAAFIPLGARRMAQEGADKDRTIGQWKELFRKALDTFYVFGPLPADVLLAGGGGRITALREALQAPDWLGEFSHTAIPNLRVLQGASFFGGDTLAGHLAGPEDVGLASLMIYSLNHQSIF